MPKLLEITKFGRPILRQETHPLTSEQITSKDTKELIKDMYKTLSQGKFGVGLAAPQVNQCKALFVLDVKPTPTLPDVEKYKGVFINPKIVRSYGKKINMWEGCVSTGEGENTLCAKVPRPNKIRLRWLDEKAAPHDEIFEGFIAHTIQHEVDHLNGILFVDKVKDTKTYMLVEEFKKFKDQAS